MMKQNKRLICIILTVVILLLIPMIAMIFTSVVNWTLLDFAVAAVLLLGFGMLCELVLRKVNRTGYRIALCVTVLSVLAMIWIELAVGIFGSPFAGS